MDKVILEDDVREKIMQHLKEDDRSLLWLCDKTKEVRPPKGIPYGTLYSCLNLKSFKLSDDNLAIINEATGEDFK